MLSKQKVPEERHFSANIVVFYAHGALVSAKRGYLAECLIVGYIEMLPRRSGELEGEKEKENRLRTRDITENDYCSSNVRRTLLGESGS